MVRTRRGGGANAWAEPKEKFLGLKKSWWVRGYNGCGLELISSVILCPVLDSATAWREERRQLLHELGEGFRGDNKSITLLKTKYIILNIELNIEYRYIVSLPQPGRYFRQTISQLSKLKKIRLSLVWLCLALLNLP